MEIETVTPREMPGYVTEKPTATQRIGFDLAKYILCIITGVTATIVIAVLAKIVYYSLLYSPPLPNESTFALAKNTIDIYRELCKAAVENGLQIFETIVVRTLLPVLTAILGYIFGSREVPRSDS